MIPIHPEHGNMIVAIIYLVRQNTLQREKSDASAIEREKAMATALHATAEGLKDLKASTDTQTGYFKTVAQTIINREVHPVLPKDE